MLIIRRLGFVILILLPHSLYGQLPAVTSPSSSVSTKPEQQDPFGRDTPRGCVMGFLQASEREEYSKAAQYLNSHDTSQRAPDLARRLAIVLDLGFEGDINQLSRSPEGSLKDQMRKDRDQVGFVETPSGKLTIELERVRRTGETPIWLFSPETLRNIPQAFDEMKASGPEAFLQRLLPRSLMRVKLFSLPLARWLMMILAIALAILAASVLTRALVPLLRPTILRPAGLDDDRHVLSLRNPFRLMLVSLAFNMIGQNAVSVLARAFWIDLSRVLAVAGVSWLVIRLSNIVTDLRSQRLARTQATNQSAVLALAHRLFKILVLFTAVAWLLHTAGVNVSAMLAGLGIGGIALALAAQKTLEDLFGGITIITRKAVRVGDFCQLADQTGTIEDIGLESTRIRTLSDTVVTIPNAKVVQMSLENYSMRQKIWFHQVFGLGLDTSPRQLREVLDEVGHLLGDDPRVEKETARIRLIEFAECSLRIEIFAYIKTTDYATFLEIQEELMLQIMDIVANKGTRLALPSQITYLDRGGRGRDGSRRIPVHAEDNMQAQSRVNAERAKTNFVQPASAGT